MIQEAADRIRGASFSLARRGYDRDEVESFLSELAASLEAEEPSGEHLAGSRAELSRVGERTAEILTKAHDVAEGIRAETERQAQEEIDAARAEAEAARAEADAYALRTRSAADEEAEQILTNARAEAEQTLGGARGEVEETLRAAQADAERTLGAANAEAQEMTATARAESEQVLAETERKRSELAEVIASLEERRDSVVGELERLARQAAAAALQIRGVQPTPPESPAQQPGTEDEGEPARA